MKDLIFEALVTEAQFRVVEHTNKGVDLNEAIAEVAREMELEESEIQELSTRAKKAPMPKPVVEDDGEAEEAETSEDQQSEPHSIEFNDADELETAIGVLMYKGIPWISKGSNYVSFDDDATVKQAHEALKRRWDFINADERTVATISFDNIADYNKVLDFIAGKNMTVLMSDDELTEDLDIKIQEDESAHKKACKDAKEQGLEAPLKPSHDLNYRALHKDKLVDIKGLDPVSDSAARSIRVVKRWK